MARKGVFVIKSREPTINQIFEIEDESFPFTIYWLFRYLSSQDSTIKGHQVAPRVLQNWGAARREGRDKLAKLNFICGSENLSTKDGNSQNATARNILNLWIFDSCSQYFSYCFPIHCRIIVKFAVQCVALRPNFPQKKLWLFSNPFSAFLETRNYYVFMYRTWWKTLIAPSAWNTRLPHPPHDPFNLSFSKKMKTFSFICQRR